VLRIRELTIFVGIAPNGSYWHQAPPYIKHEFMPRTIAPYAELPPPPTQPFLNLSMPSYTNENPVPL
jgi:hypothetical protein